MSSPAYRQDGGPDRPLGPLSAIGLGWLALLSCLGHYLDVLRGRQPFDVPAFASALRQTGLTVLPTMTLVAAGVGIILGQQIAALLARIDLPGLILLIVSDIIVLELIPLLTGILIAGRAGVGLAVRLATRLTTGEIDGLILCGLNPIQFTAAPVLLAMVAMSLAFTIWGNLICLGATFAWLHLNADVPLGQFADILQQSLTATDLLKGVAKPLLFAFAAALLAIVNGLATERNSTLISAAATRTMIGSVGLIVLIDLAFTLVT